MKLIVFLSLVLCVSAVAQPNPLNRRAMAITGLAQGPFSINNTPGLVLYFTSDSGVKSSDGTSPPNTNTTISFWTNQINLGTTPGHLSTNNGFAAFPVWYYTNGPNGQPFISFTNGAKSMLQVTAPPGAPAFTPPDTLFIVFRSPHQATGGPQMFFDSLDNLQYQVLYLDTSFNLVVTTTTGGTSLTAGPVNTSWYLLTVMWNTGAGSTIIRTNRVQMGTVTMTTPNGLLWGSIGSEWDSQFQFKGDIAAIVYATNNLNNFGSVGDYWMTNIENTLRAKYGTP